MSDRPKRVMILSAGVSSGHNAAGKALESEFRGRPGVDAVQSLDVLGLTSDLFRSLQDVLTSPSSTRRLGSLDGATT